jgi:hypothetical protein
MAKEEFSNLFSTKEYNLGQNTTSLKPLHNKPRDMEQDLFVIRRRDLVQSRLFGAWKVVGPAAYFNAISGCSDLHCETSLIPPFFYPILESSATRLHHDYLLIDVNLELMA